MKDVKLISTAKEREKQTFPKATSLLKKKGTQILERLLRVRERERWTWNNKLLFYSCLLH